MIALTDSTGAVVTEYTYDPFGSTTVTGVPSENRAQYTGRENDGTGLYYYRARYYRPDLQRFISEDPMGFIAGPNLYVYVRNSPMNYNDPDGLFFSLYHGYISYMAHKQSGDGILTSLNAAFWSILADLRPGAQSGENANAHAMAQQGQTPAQAEQSWRDYIRGQLATGTSAGQGNAEHAAQDPFSQTHGFDKVWHGFQWGDLLTTDLWKHFWGDIAPGWDRINNAIDATKNLIPRPPPDLSCRKC